MVLVTPDQVGPALALVAAILRYTGKVKVKVKVKINVKR